MTNQVPPFQPGSVLVTAMLSPVVGGILQTTFDGQERLWHVEDPDALSSYLGNGQLARTPAGPGGFREVGLLDAATGVLMLPERFPKGEGIAALAVIALHPAGQAIAALEEAQGDLAIAIEHSVRFVLSEGGTLVVEQVQEHSGAAPYVRIFQRDGQLSVWTSPQPRESAVWRPLLDDAPACGAQLPLTEVAARDAAVLAVNAYATWGMAPWDIALTFVPAGQPASTPPPSDPRRDELTTEAIVNGIYPLDVVTIPQDPSAAMLEQWARSQPALSGVVETARRLCGVPGIRLHLGLEAGAWRVLVGTPRADRQHTVAASGRAPFLVFESLVEDARALDSLGLASEVKVVPAMKGLAMVTINALQTAPQQALVTAALIRGIQLVGGQRNAGSAGSLSEFAISLGLVEVPAAAPPKRGLFGRRRARNAAPVPSISPLGGKSASNIDDPTPINEAVSVSAARSALSALQGHMNLEPLGGAHWTAARIGMGPWPARIVLDGQADELRCESVIYGVTETARVEEALAEFPFAAPKVSYELAPGPSVVTLSYAIPLSSVDPSQVQQATLSLVAATAATAYGLWDVLSPLEHARLANLGITSRDELYSVPHEMLMATPIKNHEWDGNLTPVGTSAPAAAILPDGVAGVIPGPLEPEWDSPVAEIREVVEQFKSTMTVEVQRTARDDEIYIQLSHEGDHVFAEAVSNNFLEGASRLNATDIQRLGWLGWQSPADGDAPNFHRDYPVAEPGEVATHIARTLRDVYGVDLVADGWLIKWADAPATVAPPAGRCQAV